MIRNLVFFCFLVCSSLHAQEIIRGTVTDSKTGKPIENAAIYFNLTSIWTVTDPDGNFELYVPKKPTTPLFVSFLGYERQAVENPFSGKPIQIKLKPTQTQLSAVVINGKTKTGRNRKKVSTSITTEQISRWKNLFKAYFIGKGEASNRTDLENEEVLEFSYDSIEHVVYVFSEKPLIVENEYLRYKIIYNLDTFRLEMERNKDFDMLLPSSFSIAGTSFFKDMLDPEENNKRFKKRRQRAFLGSITHFMRSLSKGKLEEEGFEVLKPEKIKTHGKTAESKMVPFEFTTIPHLNYTEVIPPARFLVVFKHGGSHSMIRAKQNFGIDEFGNYFPWQVLKFTGYMGLTGISSALPLDYFPKPE